MKTYLIRNAIIYLYEMITMKEILKDSINTHYQNKDYTEVVRDSITLLNNRNKKKI